MPPEEAEVLAGKNPDYSLQDLYDNIESGDYVSYQYNVVCYFPITNYRFY